jgi:RNA polymerase-binding transcription factor DksA
MELDLEKYRKRLLEEQRKLDQEIRAAMESNEFDSEDRPITAADAPVIDELQDVQNRVVDLKTHRLDQINAALQSIDDGTYGTCIRCGKKIDPRRLDADPAAMTCIEDARKESEIETPTM